MAINLANVNISLAQFQAVSSGKYNAGEIRITGQDSLGKVNNHVTQTGKNTVSLSHEEVIAVKTAFVKALRSGGVGREELLRVRTQLGLAPEDGGAVDRALGERSLKPLTRQQVREILDRNAQTINEHAGAGAAPIRTSDELHARVPEGERQRRAAERDATNAALAGSRTVSANRDVLLFERLVAGDFEGLSAADCDRMAEMARQKLESARQKYGGNPPADNLVRPKWSLPGGQTVEVSARKSTAAFVAHLENALSILANHFQPEARAHAHFAYTQAGAEPQRADELVAAALVACVGDTEVRELVMDNLDALLVDGANNLRTADKVRERVGKLAANFAELRQLAANDPLLLAQGRDLMRTLHGKSLPAGLLGRLVQTARELPVDALKGLAARSKGLAIHKAVVQFVGDIDRAGRESGVNGVLDGADEATLCREFLLRRMFDGFSRADLEGLHAALHSPNGARLLAAYADARNLVAGRDIPDGVRNTVGSTASMLRLQLFELNATLCRHLGIEEDVPAPFDGPVPRLSAFGAAGLDDDLVRLARERNAAAAREAVDSRVRGNSPAAERLRGVFAAKLGPEPADPESTIRDDMQSVARSILTRSVLIDMKNFATGRPTQFDRDRGRQFKATLAGVGELSADPAVARDQFAKFVTKNPAATYSSLDARSRNKAHLVMSIVSQGAHDAVFHGFGVSLDPQMNESAVSFTGGGAAERSFAIEMDENGGINVRFNSRQKPDMMLVGLEPVQCGPNSSVTMGLNVYFDAQELDRIGNVDFAAYDDEPIRQIIDVQHPANRFRVARFAIPDAFRVRMEVGARVVAEL